MYFGTSATRLTLAARLVRRAATRLMAGRYAALAGRYAARGRPLRGSLAGGPLRGTSSRPRRGAATRHKYTIPVQSFFMKPSSKRPSPYRRELAIEEDTPDTPSQDSPGLSGPIAQVSLACSEHLSHWLLPKSRLGFNNPLEKNFGFRGGAPDSGGRAAPPQWG